MKAGGTPRMDSNGRFCDPAMQETYAKTCLDLMYQAIYRTAARCGKDVDIILPIPSIDWLIALHNLMPCEVVAVKGSNKRREATFTGISTLINMSEGETISKQDVASACGYASWKQAKRILKDVMTELFEFTTRTLTRKSGEVHRQ